MAFDNTGAFVRPHNWQTDKADGRYAEALRFDEDADAVKDALTDLNQRVNALGAVDLTPYATTAALTAGLAGKQNDLGFDPVDAANANVAGGYLKLTAANQIPSSYLDGSSGAGTSGVSSFNGRDGDVDLQSTDVINALGLTPAPVNHGHTIAQVTGLQSILDGLQPLLGFTPAHETHDHVIADVTGLQTALDSKAGFSTSITTLETVFPVGQVLIVQFPVGDDGAGNPTGIPTVRGSSSIYVASGGFYYTTGGAGRTVLTGTWRYIGTAHYTVSGNGYGGFQRVA